ncbi:lipoprotein insertase outer membrane protein LolB [Pseudoxanthomonas sp. J35]|uniref:lipoprotein insertase outer membrane protein LolB n=1 Tax=Pseudoxanthomonas sp. J35 TaxID=935852 RepID=UPI00048D8515|nr:lipoprotein insertase outer membrane protein LolB [Pseudoxanthomonas sp. J35]
MSRAWHAAGLGLALLLLAGCTAAPVRDTAPAVDPARARAHQEARRVQLEAMPAWSLQGRLAVSVGDKGGSGRLDWQQDGGQWRVALSAPVTRQSWRLSGGAAGATLEGLEGGTRYGPDAGALLLEATGWPIPVEELSWWVRGLASPGAELEFGADGRPRRLLAGGWTVDYQEWSAATDGWPDMPRRLQAQREGVRVRLVVDQWGTP